MEFFKTPKHDQTCVIRVVVNNTQPQKYQLTRHVGGDLAVVINVQNINNLENMAQLIQEDLVVKRRYNVKFNFSSTPNAVTQNTKFREKMNTIFQLPKTSIATTRVTDFSDVDALVEIIQLHRSHHGNAPDMKKYYLPKTMDKILNYIRSTVDAPSLPKEMAVVIARRLNDIEER